MFLPPPSSAVEDERPRKRVRKGTRSCWECKRRKIRCEVSPEHASICSGCLARGTACQSQEYPEKHDTPSAGTQVGDRLGRVELLLEKLVAKIAAYEEPDDGHKINTPESIGIDILTSHSSDAAPNLNENAPILSLFDNRVIGHRDNSNQSQITTPSTQPAVKTPSCGPPSKLGRVRQTLIELLPSQHDINLLVTAANSSAMVHALSRESFSNISAEDESVVMQTFDLAYLVQQPATGIARNILFLAICMQQLPPSFDISQLHLTTSVDACVEKYCSTVHALVTSDDEVASTMAGLECLILQGLFHMNAGSPRRSWLTFRRALNLAQLMSIHRREGSDSHHPGGSKMWHQIVKCDRYISLLLGLPYGSADDAFGPEETFQNLAIDVEFLFCRKLCNISGRVIERNHTGHSHAYATTQEIDDELDDLAKNLPQTWWEYPPASADNRTLNVGPQWIYAMHQIWYFQIKAFLHLPFMLRAGTERRYDYSKFSALKASREILIRYLALQNTDIMLFRCKIIDFVAFTATVTVLLGIIEPSRGGENHETHERENDKKLVQKALSALEELSMGGRDVVASQSVDVIKTLLAVDSNSGGNLRLTIPYFGTIIINRPTPAANQHAHNGNSVLQQQQAVPIEPQIPSQGWQGLPFASQDHFNPPMVSFMSSQFPDLGPDQSMGSWNYPEIDTVLFDSLLNTDMDGNWVV